MNNLFHRHLVVTLEGADGKTKTFEHYIPSDLQYSIEFDSKFGSGDPATIKLYNVAQSTLSMLEPKKSGKSTKLASAEISAGYGENLFLLNSGNVIQRKFNYSGVDSILEIKIAPGVGLLDSIWISQSFKKTNAEKILKQILSDNKFPYSLTESKSPVEFSQYTINSTLRVAIQNLCNLGKLEYEFKSGKLTIYPIGGEKKQDNIVVLNRMSGLIGSPERKGSVYKVKSLLQPTLGKGEQVRVEYVYFGKQVSVDLKIRNGKHHGGSFGQTYYTEFEAVAI